MLRDMGTGEWIALGSFLVVAIVAALGGLLYIIHAEQAKARVKQDDLDAKAAEIKAELVPNHGSSMRDAVDRIEVAVAGLKADAVLQAKLMEEHVGTLRRYGGFISDLNADFQRHLQAHINKE